MPSPKRHQWFRTALLIVVVVLLFVIGRPALHLLRTALKDADELKPPAPGFVDDASRLNATKVARVLPVPEDAVAAEAQLADILARARAEGLRVSISGARHSMGGHTMYPGGVVIDMLPFADMELDEERDVLHVQSGARWSDIIAYLDERGRSVAIMQSNNSFTVGGSISVNCHGWQYGRPPIASSVLGFRLMKADGSIVRCSRDENAELFSLALGGYGLFGVILDVDLEVVPNERYRLDQLVVPAGEALETFDRELRRGLSMAYARMSIVSDDFLGEVIINVFRADPAPDGDVPELTEPGMTELRRSLFRGSVGSDYGKALRWEAETRLQKHLTSRLYSRNQLLNESVEVFQNRSAESTDILHEYFVPREGVVRFVQSLRAIVPAHDGDLLNVTVRHVDTDDDTFLRYADEPMFAFVMLFNQAMTPDGEAAMEAMTREMIEAALEVGGRYYLPYRLHATPEQFRAAYPQADRFFELKRAYDPDELFQNRFYDRYSP